MNSDDARPSLDSAAKGLFRAAEAATDAAEA